MERRYIVETCYRPGIWSVILRTDNYTRAANTANFWDERQDTRLIDLHNVHYYDAAMRRFDQAIARLA